MPHMSEEYTLSIPIFLASDENFAPFLCTTMYSILQNTNQSIEFYVLDGGIFDTTKQQIAKSLKEFTHFSLEYTDMSSFALERFPNKKHFTVNTFSRYFIPQIKPQINKIIYLDVDIIVQCDIAELYQQNLDGYALAAVPELQETSHRRLKRTAYPAFKGGTKYFNAGVLLIDLEQFRANNISQKLIDLTLEKADLLLFPDQDVLNILFDCNFKILDSFFNYLTCHSMWFLQKYPDIGTRAKIIHYGGKKPWKFASVESSEAFWTVLKKTDFYEQVSRNVLIP